MFLKRRGGEKEGTCAWWKENLQGEDEKNADVLGKRKEEQARINRIYKENKKGYKSDWHENVKKEINKRNQ